MVETIDNAVQLIVLIGCLACTMVVSIRERDEGWYLLSGFYADDMKILSEESATLSLTVIRHTTNGEWACMMLR